MNKLKKYLDKNEIKYTPAKFGANYFYDSNLDLHFDGIEIVFGYDTPEESRKSAQARRKIEKYINRYGYEIIRSGGNPGYQFIFIMRCDEWQALKDYDIFADQSRERCQEHIHFMHEYYTPETMPNYNDDLKGIMKFYEEEYKAFLESDAETKAEYKEMYKAA